MPVFILNALFPTLLQKFYRYNFHEAETLCCLAKFQQNPKLEEVLLSTGEELLEEDTTGWHDNIWGNCTCSKCKAIPGKNLLGKTLMEVRKTLKEQKEEKVKRPDLRRNSSGNQS